MTLRKDLYLAILALVGILTAQTLAAEDKAPPPDPKLAERYLNEVYSEEFRRAHENSSVDGLSDYTPPGASIDAFDAQTRYQEMQSERRQQFLEDRNVLEFRMQRAPRGSDQERQARSDMMDLYDRHIREQPRFPHETTLPQDTLFPDDVGSPLF